MSAAELEPTKGRDPVAASCSNTPSENTSDRASTSRPSTCSGDM